MRRAARESHGESVPAGGAAARARDGARMSGRLLERRRPCAADSAVGAAHPGPAAADSAGRRGSAPIAVTRGRARSRTVRLSATRRPAMARRPCPGISTRWARDGTAGTVLPRHPGEDLRPAARRPAAGVSLGACAAGPRHAATTATTITITTMVVRSAPAIREGHPGAVRRAVPDRVPGARQATGTIALLTARLLRRPRTALRHLGRPSARHLRRAPPSSPRPLRLRRARRPLRPRPSTSRLVPGPTKARTPQRASSFRPPSAKTDSSRLQAAVGRVPSGPPVTGSAAVSPIGCMMPYPCART